MNILIFLASGMLVPDCHMQTVFLKDLVSAVAPTNPYSFVNYLVKHKKFYRFLTSRLRTVSREEFSDYLRWAAEDMNNLYFSHTVENIDFDKKRRLFLVQTSQENILPAISALVQENNLIYHPV